MISSGFVLTTLTSHYAYRRRRCSTPIILLVSGWPLNESFSTSLAPLSLPRNPPDDQFQESRHRARSPSLSLFSLLLLVSSLEERNKRKKGRKICSASILHSFRSNHFTSFVSPFLTCYIIIALYIYFGQKAINGPQTYLYICVYVIYMYSPVF